MRLSLVCFVALLLGAPVANAQVGTTGDTDKATATRIEKRIAADPMLKKYDIKVVVDGGVATLSGSVATEADRTKAAADAKMAGITRVDNQLLVEPDAGTRGVKGTAGKVGEKTKEGAQKAGEEITDGWITTRIKTKFVGEDALKDSDVHVSTDDHVVTLTGTVMSAAGRAKAVALAKEVEGVRRVEDRLTVGPKKP